MKTFFNLHAKTPQGTDLPMSKFSGKVVLVVNTATKCGLAPQFRELEDLHQKYMNRGLIILGFPSNQFLNQEPVSNESMVESCQLNFGVSFQLTEKIKVNGNQTHPIFKYLKDQLPGKRGKRIKWNFTKFLITAEGVPYKRYEPRVQPVSMENDILVLLSEPDSIS
jgi:glutathione peroxidase